MKRRGSSACPLSHPPPCCSHTHTSQFTALNLLFKSVDVSTRTTPRVDPTPGGGARVCVATTQRYTLPLLLAPIVVETDLTLTVNASGKIVAHTDA